MSHDKAGLGDAPKGPPPAPKPTPEYVQVHRAPGVPVSAPRVPDSVLAELCAEAEHMAPLVAGAIPDDDVALALDLRDARSELATLRAERDEARARADRLRAALERIVDATKDAPTAELADGRTLVSPEEEVVPNAVVADQRSGSHAVTGGVASDQTRHEAVYRAVMKAIGRVAETYRSPTAFQVVRECAKAAEVAWAAEWGKP